MEKANKGMEKYLEKYQRLINRRLIGFFDKKEEKLKKVSDFAVKMCREIRDFTLRGGKRLRPILVYYGYLAGNGKNKEAILDASIFAELLHSYLLIHDDIMDKDEIRRGKPTIHSLYKEKYKNLPDRSEHLGISSAILAGDLTAPFAYEILAESNFPNDFKNKAIRKLNIILEDVIAGQTIDIFGGIGRQLEINDILKIMEYKTARYTIEGPLHIGAILAGAPDSVLRKLSQCAVPLGIAFQIRDDILGVFGDTKVTGKSASSDIREGKQTLLIVEALRVAGKNQKKEILEAFDNPNATEKQIKNVREIIKNTGALEKASKEAIKLASRARNIIEKSDFSKETKQFLIGISDYILEREK